MNTQPFNSKPFLLLREVLSAEDISQLKKVYSHHTANKQLPCYAFLYDDSPHIYKKITRLVETAIGLSLFYLNDFFFYTSNVFSTPWHVDTELYLFKSAVNAWILLEPDSISNPLGFVDSLNTPSSTSIYHSVEQEGDELIFADYVNSDILELNIHDVEASHITTPEIRVGDILLLDPLRFHRTNTTAPKGACVFKYVFSTDGALLRENHLPDVMWPELSLYKRLYSPDCPWSEFLDRIRNEVSTNLDKSPLISGFYPENFPYLVEKASSLK